MKKHVFLSIFGLTSCSIADRSSLYGLATFEPAYRTIRLNNETPDGETDEFGSSVAGCDVNGDGFADVVIGDDEGGSTFQGTVSVFFGGEEPLESFLRIEAWEGEFFGLAMDCGDVNGDGFADVAVGDLVAGPGARGRVYLYFGASNFDDVVDQMIDAPMVSDRFGVSLTVSADMNGDGKNDLVVGDSDAQPDESGGAWFYPGTDGGIDTSAPISLGSGVSEYGRTVRALGDLNGDSFDEVAVSDVGRISIFAGGSTISAEEARVLTSMDPLVGKSMVGNIDLNHDGYGEFFIIAPEEERVLWFYGESGESLFGAAHFFEESSLEDATFDVLQKSDQSSYGILGRPDAGKDARGETSVYSFEEDVIVWGSSAEPGSVEYGRTVTRVGDIDGNGSMDMALGDRAIGVGSVFIWLFDEEDTVDSGNMDDSGNTQDTDDSGHSSQDTGSTGVDSGELVVDSGETGDTDRMIEDSGTGLDSGELEDTAVRQDTGETGITNDSGEQDTSGVSEEETDTEDVAKGCGCSNGVSSVSIVSPWLLLGLLRRRRG